MDLPAGKFRTIPAMKYRPAVRRPQILSITIVIKIESPMGQLDLHT